MTTEKNLEIEYLRGISILFVLISHLPLLSSHFNRLISPLFQHLSFGVGVDLFFCISGYVVSSSFINKLDEYSTFWRTASTFWIRRIFRLLPSAWLWVILGLFCSVYLNQSGLFLDVQQNLKSFATIATFSSNIGLLFKWIAPNYQYWSLSLEEQFYILFPFFMFFLKGINARIIFLLLIITIQFPLRRNPFGNEMAQYLAAIRTDGFAWGILVYLMSQTHFYQKIMPIFLEKSSWLKLFSTILGCFLLIWVPVYFHHTTYSMGLLAMITALLVWIASYSKDFIYIPVNARPLFLWLGSRSYAIYLIHLFAFRLLQEISYRLFEPDATKWDVSISVFLGLGVLTAIVILAELNFRFIETPLRSYGIRLTNNTLRRKISILSV